MATLEVRLANLGTRVATECKALRTLINGNLVDLSSLNTAAKSSLVAALNELQAEIIAIGTPATINDASSASASQTWSINKISSEIATAISVLTTGAPGALNTLDELAAALGDDANFASTITTALSNRVRTDTAAQGLLLAQKQNARTNIDAYGSVEIGNPDADLVAVFNTGLI
jgi:hypothetical protein